MESLPTCISARSDTTVLDESVTIDTDAFSESCEDLVALQTNEPIDTTVADESVTVDTDAFSERCEDLALQTSEPIDRGW